MKREREELKAMEALWGRLRKLQPDATVKAQAMKEIEGWIERKKVRHTPSWRELAFIELQYISPGFWVMQGSVAAALVIWLERTSVLRGGLKDYLQWISVSVFNLLSFLYIVPASCNRAATATSCKFIDSCLFEICKLSL